MLLAKIPECFARSSSFFTARWGFDSVLFRLTPFLFFFFFFFFVLVWMEWVLLEEYSKIPWRRTLAEGPHEDEEIDGCCSCR